MSEWGYFGLSVVCAVFVAAVIVGTVAPCMLSSQISREEEAQERER